MLNVFHASTGDWRHVATQVAKYMLGYIYGLDNVIHMMMTDYDWWVGLRRGLMGSASTYCGACVGPRVSTKTTRSTNSTSSSTPP